MGIIITPELFSSLLERVAGGRSLIGVLSDPDMPGRTQFYEYLKETPGAADDYARACEEREERMFEELTDIADDGRNDWMERERKDGTIETVLDREHVERSKLRIEARKWMLGKMRPKKYGEKLDVDHSGALTVTIASDVAKIG